MRRIAGGIELDHPSLGRRWLYCDDEPEILFTENETNYKRLFGIENRCACVKDGKNDAVAPMPMGTKAAAHYKMQVPPGGSVTIRLRLTDVDFSGVIEAAFDGFDQLFSMRKNETDEFYGTVIPQDLSSDA